jgi:hypothetical protein
MQYFYCISAQGGELVAVIGPLPNKYFIFYLLRRLKSEVEAGKSTEEARDEKQETTHEEREEVRDDENRINRKQVAN